MAEALLLESGDDLLLEDLFRFLLEGGTGTITDFGYACLSAAAPTATITASKDC